MKPLDYQVPRTIVRDFLNLGEPFGVKVPEKPEGCSHPYHNPPTHLRYPGTYTHTCPGCGEKQTIIVPQVTPK